MVHAYASALQTPRGDLQRKDDDPAGFGVREIAMDPDYARYKYSFVRRRRMEVAYGREAGKFIRDWRPDVVVSGNTPTEAQESLVAATVGTGGKFFYWVQDFYSIAVDKLCRRKIPLVGGLVGGYYRRLDGRQFARSAGIIAITDDFIPILRDDFGVPEEKVAVIPNWAVLEELPVREKDNPWARQHGLADKFVFLYSGTLGMKHNPDLLLGLALQYRDDPSVRVVVVSEGIGAEWLRKESAARGLDNLLLFPYQPFAMLPDLLASGDVLVSVLEEDAGVFSVPSKVLSYLCAGRALLLAVPAENLAARLVRENHAGLTVAPADKAGFLRAAEELHRDRPSCMVFGQNSRNYAENAFDIRKTVIKFENLFRDALK